MGRVRQYGVIVLDAAAPAGANSVRERGCCMTGIITNFEDRAIPDRECGPCNACCVHLTINDVELQKPNGIRCPNNGPDNRCTIYETRPQTCRTFYCGWRLLKWVRPTLRPEESGVLIRMLYRRDGQTGEGQSGISVILLNKTAAKAEGLAETVAAGIAAGVPVYISIPGPPGYTSGQARLNEVLADAVALRDKAEVQRVLRQAYVQGKHGNHRKIVLKPPIAGGGTEDDPSVAGGKGSGAEVE